MKARSEKPGHGGRFFHLFFIFFQEVLLVMLGMFWAAEILEKFLAANIRRVIKQNKRRLQKVEEKPKIPFPRMMMMMIDKQIT